jgi:hypothetical protein
MRTSVAMWIKILTAHGRKSVAGSPHQFAADSHHFSQLYPLPPPNHPPHFPITFTAPPTCPLLPLPPQLSSNFIPPPPPSYLLPLLSYPLLLSPPPAFLIASTTLCPLPPASPLLPPPPPPLPPPQLIYYLLQLHPPLPPTIYHFRQLSTTSANYLPLPPTFPIASTIFSNCIHHLHHLPQLIHHLCQLTHYAHHLYRLSLLLPPHITSIISTTSPNLSTTAALLLLPPICRNGFPDISLTVISATRTRLYILREPLTSNNKVGKFRLLDR